MDGVALKTGTASRMFGLTVRSDIELPELFPSVLREHDKPDVQIKRGELSWNDDNPGGYEYYWVKDNRVMIYIPDTAVFAIEDGSTITYSPIGKEKEQTIRLYLLGTCMGALLMQRNLLPLHGSSVVIDGKAYAFIGLSGAGKSTLAAAFRQRGYSLVSDDVTAVTFVEDQGPPVVIPSYPQQKLWDASIAGLGMDSSLYKPLVHEAAKYAVPIGEQLMSYPVPLAGVYELAPSDQEQVTVARMKGLERLHLLFQHTYRHFLVPKMKRMPWHFDFSSRIAGQCRMYQLRRPSSSFSVDALTEIILHTIEKGEE